MYVNNQVKDLLLVLLGLWELTIM